MIAIWAYWPQYASIDKVCAEKVHSNRVKHIPSRVVSSASIETQVLSGSESCIADWTIFMAVIELRTDFRSKNSQLMRSVLRDSTAWYTPCIAFTYKITFSRSCLLTASSLHMYTDWWVRRTVGRVVDCDAQSCPGPVGGLRHHGGAALVRCNSHHYISFFSFLKTWFLYTFNQ